MRGRLLTGLAVFALTANVLAAQGLTVSGLLDSTVTMSAGAGDTPAFVYGLEEYANLRMQAKIRGQAVFYGAVNCIAAAGSAAQNVAAMAGLGLARGYAPPGIAPSSFSGGQNYVAGFELERLYFRLNGDILDFDGGLMRLPFGYGQVWGPSDFLNPKNPLVPDARPRAVLGGALSWYPADPFKLLAFGAAPRDPFSAGGGGGLAGLSMDRHWEKASLQLLYAFESPNGGANRGIHRAGVSVKADVEAGLVMDALYTWKPTDSNVEEGPGIDGLSFSLGADYSFFAGNLIALAEYLYNGAASSTAFDAEQNLFGRQNEHYLYASLTWRFNDYTTLGAALIAGISDGSVTPLLTLSHDLFQGCALTLSAQVPLDRDLFFGDGNRGELGPIPPGQDSGYYCTGSAKIRLRF
jgi:hypothetical protein